MAILQWLLQEYEARTVSKDISTILNFFISKWGIWITTFNTKTIETI